MSERYADPADELNGPQHRTGKPCIDRCGREAGTAWSPLWCQPCNAARMDQIGKSLSSVLAKMHTDSAGASDE